MQNNNIYTVFHQQNDPLTPFAISYCIKMWNEEILTIDECKDLTAHILSLEGDMIAQNPQYKDDGGTGLGEYSLTAKFQAYNALQWDHPVCVKIKQKLRQGIDLMCPNFNEKIYARMWANVIRSRQAMKPHQHACDEYSFLSANLTLQAWDTQTVYQNPYGLDSISFENKPGWITMFPEYMIHWTTMHMNPVPRVTLGVDLLTETALQPENLAKLVEI